MKGKDNKNLKHRVLCALKICLLWPSTYDILYVAPPPPRILFYMLPPCTYSILYVGPPPVLFLVVGPPPRVPLYTSTAVTRVFIKL